VAADGGSPWLEGIHAPAIIFPRSLLAACSRRELRLMLAHELAHLKRRDLQWGWLATAAHALFFFHPLVWIAGGEWRPSAARLSGQAPWPWGCWSRITRSRGG
jgi:beta-lactamase regulating signal transducer with metallopeptidase domain